MSQLSGEEYLNLMRRRYLGTGRQGKDKLIDEVCELLEIGCKHAIRLLNRATGGATPRPGRPRIYRTAELQILKDIWWTSEQPCGKRLKAVLCVDDLPQEREPPFQPSLCDVWNRAAEETQFMILRQHS